MNLALYLVLIRPGNSAHLSSLSLRERVGGEGQTKQQKPPSSFPSP